MEIISKPVVTDHTGCPVKHGRDFWFLVKIDLSRVRYYTSVLWKSKYFQVTRNTRSCSAGHPVYDQIEWKWSSSKLKTNHLQCSIILTTVFHTEVVHCDAGDPYSAVEKKTSLLKLSQSNCVLYLLILTKKGRKEGLVLYCLIFRQKFIFHKAHQIQFFKTKCGCNWKTYYKLTNIISK